VRARRGCIFGRIENCCRKGAREDIVDSKEVLNPQV